MLREGLCGTVSGKKDLARHHERASLKAASSLGNGRPRRFPRSCTKLTIITMTTRAAIRPYSMATDPSLALRKALPRATASRRVVTPFRRLAITELSGRQVCNWHLGGLCLGLRAVQGGEHQRRKVADVIVRLSSSGEISRHHRRRHHRRRRHQQRPGYSTPL